MNDQLIKTTAIDIALLPPEKIMELSKYYNSKITNLNPDGIKLDNTHLPHISLVQQFIDNDRLSELNSTIAKTLDKFQPIRLKIIDIDSFKLSDGKEASYFIFENSSEIQKLHEVLMEVSNPFVASGDRHSFIADPDEQIRAVSLDWTASFREKSSGSNFEAHITLGIGHKPGLENEIEFTIDRLMVCHLGNFNTCRKILKEWQLTNYIKQIK